MRASLNEIKSIEKFLNHELEIQDALLFEATLLVNPMMKERVRWQAKIVDAIKAYYYKKLKKDLLDVQHQLFSNPEKKDFQKSITQCFQQ